MPLLQQELPTLPEHLSSFPVVLVEILLFNFSFCVACSTSLFVLFLFGHSIVCPPIYDFGLPLRHCQTLLFEKGVCVGECGKDQLSVSYLASYIFQPKFRSTVISRYFLRITILHSCMRLV